MIDEPAAAAINSPSHRDRHHWHMVGVYVMAFVAGGVIKPFLSELAIENPRLWTRDRRLKFMLIVTVVNAFSLHLLDPVCTLLVASCCATAVIAPGPRSQYRLRPALTHLWRSHPPPFTSSWQILG